MESSECRTEKVNFSIIWFYVELPSFVNFCTAVHTRPCKVVTCTLNFIMFKPNNKFYSNKKDSRLHKHKYNMHLLYANYDKVFNLWSWQTRKQTKSSTTHAKSSNSNWFKRESSSLLRKVLHFRNIEMRFAMHVGKVHAPVRTHRRMHARTHARTHARRQAGTQARRQARRHAHSKLYVSTEVLEFGLEHNYSVYKSLKFLTSYFRIWDAWDGKNEMFLKSASLLALQHVRCFPQFPMNCLKSETLHCMS